MKSFTNLFLLASLTLITLGACESVQPIAEAAAKAGADVLLNGQSGNQGGANRPTNGEVINGLKQALEIAATNSSTLASKLDGFYKNPIF